MTTTESEPMRGGLPLNGLQADVVDHAVRFPVTVAAAGAGTGKTQTTVATVLHLVDLGVAHLDDFALVTFTQKAAAELRARLLREVTTRAAAEPRWAAEQERVSAMFVGTIHAFCRHVLRSFGAGVAVARDSDITFSAFRQKQAVMEALESAVEGNDDDSPHLAVLADPHYQLVEQAGAVLDYCATVRESVADVVAATEAQPLDPAKPVRVAFARVLADAAERYQRDKAEAGVLDGHDLLTELADALAGPDDAMARTVAARFPCLFVDEFQDTDVTQLAVVESLLPYLRKLLVVGDRKQAIYGWRAADSSLLERLARRQPDRSDPLPLNISMRPTRPLLDAQNRLFAALAERYPVLGDPLSPHGRDVVDPLPPLVYLRDAPAEAPAAVARHLRTLLGRPLPGDAEGRAIEPGDIAVLTRSNRMAEAMVDQLGAELRDVAAVVLDQGSSFYQQPGVVSVYRLLRLVLEPHRDLVVSAALATPLLAGIDARAEELRCIQYGSDDGASPLADWFAAEGGEAHKAVEELRRHALVETVPQLLGRLYRLFDASRVFDPPSMHHVELLRERSREVFSSEQALTLRAFVDWLATAIRDGRPERSMDDEGGRPLHIRVLTIHRAKGLEFPIVVVPGMTSPVVKGAGEPEFVVDGDGLDLRLPCLDGGDIRSPRFDAKVQERVDAQVAEEFRLFYVAVTRAQHQVVLVGDRDGPPKRPDQPRYSWRDEVVRVLGPRRR